MIDYYFYLYANNRKEKTVCKILISVSGLNTCKTGSCKEKRNWEKNE